MRSILNTTLEVGMAARFDEATFADSDVYLNDARFTALASFRATKFRAGTDLTTADYGGQVDCTDAQVLPPYDPDYPKPDPTAPPAGRWPRGWQPELLGFRTNETITGFWCDTTRRLANPF
jgi:hypothetical protein